MVPLNEKDLMLDLMRHFGLPVVVAARTTLGTINHICSHLPRSMAAHLNVRGVVLIGAENVENRSAIETYGNVRVIGHIPVLETNPSRGAGWKVFEKDFDRLAFSIGHDRTRFASVAPIHERRR